MVRFSIKNVNLCIGGKHFANLLTFKREVALTVTGLE